MGADRSSGAAPVAVLAMSPFLTPKLFTRAQLDRLGRLCRVPDERPLSDFGEARAEALLAEAQVLVTGWGCPLLDAPALERAPRLALVAHAAGTVKPLVTEAVFARGVEVTSAAAANAVPVAEYALAAILLANKRAFALQRAYAAERSFKPMLEAHARPLGNYGRVVGLVGASRVGRKLIELLRPFALRVQVFDPYLPDEEARALGVEPVALDTLLATSDVVSLHAPSTPETRHLLDARRLGLMRDGTTLVNTARGALVDHDALEKELVSGRIEAVIDTTEPEVLPADSPLYELPNVFLTPHIAGSMGEETQRMSELVLEEIERFVRGEPLAHRVDPELLPRLA
jgi:phosphoglycerate dehydrogenase-like enzyme